MSYAYDQALAVAALEKVRALPYKIGLRKVFYKLLQDGMLGNKGDYARLKDVISRARHNLLDGWTPDTLADDTRTISESTAPVSEVETLATLPYYVDVRPDLYEGADAVPFLIYEAKGSAGQFDHIAPWCDHAGLGGDASIPHKFNIAKHCEVLNERYGLPVHVLYFGDFDKKGLEIPERALADIRKWTPADIRFTRIGLNAGHAERFNIPDKPESPGSYEWEALQDEDAGILIAEGLATVVDVAEVNRRIESTQATTDALREKVRLLLESAS